MRAVTFRYADKFSEQKNFIFVLFPGFSLNTDKELEIHSKLRSFLAGKSSIQFFLFVIKSELKAGSFTEFVMTSV
jgi:hypothetical protein